MCAPRECPQATWHRGQPQPPPRHAEDCWGPQHHKQSMLHVEGSGRNRQVPTTSDGGASDTDPWRHTASRLAAKPGGVGRTQPWQPTTSHRPAGAAQPLRMNAPGTAPPCVQRPPPAAPTELSWGHPGSQLHHQQGHAEGRMGCVALCHELTAGSGRGTAHCSIFALNVDGNSLPHLLKALQCL